MTFFSGEMAHSYRELCDQLLAAGQTEAAADFGRRFVETLREDTVGPSPAPFKLLDLAHAYVRARYDAFRDPEQSLKLVDAAMALQEQNPRGTGLPAGAWRIRGLAHFRLGNWEDAKAAMHKSIELRTQDVRPPKTFGQRRGAVFLSRLGRGVIGLELGW